MEIALDDAGHAASSSTSPYEFTQTIWSPAARLYVFVSSLSKDGYAVPSGVTFDGVAMTMDEHVQIDDGTNFFDASKWVLDSPSVGSLAVVVSFSGGSSVQSHAASLSLTGVGLDGAAVFASEGTGSGGVLAAELTPAAEGSWLLSSCIYSRALTGTAPKPYAPLAPRTGTVVGHTRFIVADSNGPVDSPVLAKWLAAGTTTVGGLMLAFTVAPAG